MDMFPLHFDTDTELHEAMMKFKHDLYKTDSVLCQIFATCKPLCTILPRCTNMLLTCHNQSWVTNTNRLGTEKNEQCHVFKSTPHHTHSICQDQNKWGLNPYRLSSTIS